MNINLEACRACPNQCDLETRALRVAEQGIGLPIAEQRSLVSRMNHLGATLKCPQSEINSAREEVEDYLGLDRRFTKTRAVPPRGIQEFYPRYDFKGTIDE